MKTLHKPDQKCPECGSQDFEWVDGHRVVNNGFGEKLEGALVLGCLECSETILVVPLDKVAHYLNEVSLPKKSNLNLALPEGAVKEFDESAMRFGFGKYRGELLEQIADRDPQYVVWAYENVDKDRFNCPRSLYVACCEEAGRFPEDEPPEPDPFGDDEAPF